MRSITRIEWKKESAQRKVKANFCQNLIAILCVRATEKMQLNCVYKTKEKIEPSKKSSSPSSPSIQLRREMRTNGFYVGIYNISSALNLLGHMRLILYLRCDDDPDFHLLLLSIRI